MFFVCPQSVVEKYLEVRRRDGCRVSLRHECKSRSWLSSSDKLIRNDSVSVREVTVGRPTVTSGPTPTNVYVKPSTAFNCVITGMTTT
jgi:hypothetical protein